MARLLAVHVETTELGHQQGADLLGVKRPALGKRQLLGHRAAALTAGALGLRAGVEVRWEQPFGSQADAQAYGQHEDGQLPQGSGPVEADAGDPAEQEPQPQSEQSIVEHLRVGRIGRRTDCQGEAGRIAKVAARQQPLQAEEHEGEQGNDAHLGVMRRIGEAEEGRR
jgi:hypothetical protein